MHAALAPLASRGRTALAHATLSRAAYACTRQGQLSLVQRRCSPHHCRTLLPFVQADATDHTPLHSAARSDNTAAIHALLALVPSLPLAPDEEGWLPCHTAACCGKAAALKQLLAAAPNTATAITDDGETLHYLAAERGHVDVLRLLLQLAPEPAAGGSLAPLRIALHSGHLPAARLLLSCGSTPAVLRCLAAANSQASLPLFTEAVAARLPLLPDEWQLVPAACPGLGPLLPQALALSFEQARQLVRQLPAADAQRLRAGALALARAQRVRRVYLAPPLAHRILALSLA